MAEYTNFVENTSLPIHENADGNFSSDVKQRKFFDNYYTKVDSVDPAQFDIVRGFLLGRELEVSTVDNLTITLLEVAKEQQLDPVELIDQLELVDDKIQLNNILCILLNSTRNRTSVLGYGQATVVNTNIQRAILA